MKEVMTPQTLMQLDEPFISFSFMCLCFIVCSCFSSVFHTKDIFHRLLHEMTVTVLTVTNCSCFHITILPVQGLRVIDFQMPEYLRVLENAIQFGNPVLLQNVQEELDPSLNPVLNKSLTQTGQTLTLLTI